MNDRFATAFRSPKDGFSWHGRPARGQRAALPDMGGMPMLRRAGRWTLLRSVAGCVVATIGIAVRAETKTDLEYGHAGGERLLLDVHIPDGEGPFPIAILVHGGGWGSGDKSGSDKPGNGADITPWFEPLTAAKFTWFSINYRLAPQHRWPACIEDVNTAIRWVKAHAAEFKGDPRRIALLGHSAGGHLVCYAAARAERETRVQAVVGFAPVTDLEADCERRGGVSPALQNLFDLAKELTPETRRILREASPITHASAETAPTLILHGDADKTVPLQQSLDYQKKLRAVGAACELVTLADAPHALLAWEQADPSYRATFIGWLHRTLGSPGKGPVAP
jgi:acetyl esterase/lipase